MELNQVYKDCSNFLIINNPSNQYLCLENEKAAYLGKSKSISKIKLGYGVKICETWIMSQIENLNEFCGVKDKITPIQNLELSRLIISEYGYLKASELMLFFAKFKTGHFGKFYGVIDPIVITNAVNEYLKERMAKRNKYLAEIEKEKKELEERKRELETIDIETWNEIKWLFNL
jgi:hypothetical protein